MRLSVVVPTLNGRERLVSCLDALAERVRDRGDTEVIVVNGPSVDGTTGMVRERDDVDVLVEIDERNINVARNAGIDRARGDVIALVGHDLVVEEDWFDSVDDALAAPTDDEGTHREDGGARRDDGAHRDGERTRRNSEQGDLASAVVTGPTNQSLRAGVATETVEERTIAGRSVTYINGGNVAFRRAAIEAIDGFDEYLETGGARDAAHRLAAQEYGVAWAAGMGVRREVEADGGQTERDYGWRYRSLAYRLVKNYGPRPTTLYRLGRHAVTDAVDALRDVLRGDASASGWFATGRAVTTGLLVGVGHGTLSRVRAAAPARNSQGLSARADRAVAVYDRRNDR